MKIAFDVYNSVSIESSPTENVVQVDNYEIPQVQAITVC